MKYLKEHWTSCVQWTHGASLLHRILQGAREIEMNTFLQKVNVTDEERRAMKQYPWDFRFFSWKHGRVYFYRHSATEYFFK